MDIAVIDDDPLLLHTVKMVLEEDFGEVLTLSHPHLLEDQLSKLAIKVVLLDMNFAIGDSNGEEGLAWVAKITNKWKNISVIVLTAHGFVDIAVKSLKLGAVDFLEKPFINQKLIATVKAAHMLAASKQELETVIAQKTSLVNQLNQNTSYLSGTSKKMQIFHQTIMKVAETDAPVLIVGEHGSGKEMTARLIHQKSQRVTEPFVHVDLAAMPETLFESALFGHSKGSFTDAVKDQVGFVETANLGTLFLDGIDELPLRQQMKLLTVIQKREISRIGEQLPRAVDFRLITSTRMPADLLAKGEHFRQDLYFRINTVTLELPPLRERNEDILLFAEHFLTRFNSKYQKAIHFSKKTMNLLTGHHWPGNIRELENTIERMVILHGEEQDLIALLKDQEQEPLNNLYDLEKEKIAEIIERHAGNISKAAHELGIGRNTLYRKIKKYDL